VKKYAVITFGCRVNQADSLGFEEQLQARGLEAADTEAADLVIVNTCSVTSSADQSARQTVRRIARTNPDARIVVTGCYATRRPDEIDALPNVVRIVPNTQKSSFVTAIEDLGLTTAERFADGYGGCGASIEPGVAGRTAFTLRVQTGCAESCTYCIIPSTRGAPQSIDPVTLLREIERIAAAGFKEIALTGVHLGSYGRDLWPTSSLLELLTLIAHGAPKQVRFRISSLEPMECSEAIVDLVAASPVFAPHFHLPLQHASDRILSAMRRPYTLAHYDRLVDRIRHLIPEASIGTDVIVGFPGETDEDFSLLSGYLPQAAVTHVHVFPYSDRPGTVAFTMTPKVGGGAIRERARVVRDISRTLNQRFHVRQIGAVHRALTIDDGTTVVTGNYLKLRIPEGHRRNEWLQVKVVGGGDPMEACVIQSALEGDGRQPLRWRLEPALDDQLAAGGANVAPSALSHRYDNTPLG
jgi:threonylcarbamoyladenosine tRNA methylthiotransferase MtaB